MIKAPFSSSPWFFVLSALVSGILLCFFFYVTWYMMGILFTASGILFYRTRHVKRGLCYLFLFVMTLGMWMVKTQFYYAPQDIYHQGRFYYKKVMHLRGVFITDVVEKTHRRSSKKVGTLSVTEIKMPWGWRPSSGKVLVQVFHKSSVEYGDYVEFSGKLHRPFQIQGERGFSYRQYLRNKGIHYILSVGQSGSVDLIQKNKGFRWFENIIALRKKGESVFKNYLTDREAGIMIAMILGERSLMPKDIRALFVRTGTAHILAISGLHVGILTGVLFLFIRLFPLPRFLQGGVLIIFLLMYAVLTGLRASVLRAVLMAVIFLMGYALERKSFGLNSLGLAGCVLLCWQPFFLFDIGFQLSFVCVFFILLGAGPLSARLKNVCPKWIAEGLSVSLCAWAASLGLLIYYFGMVALIGLIANVFILPLVSLVLVCGLLLLAIGGWWSFGGLVMSLCLKLALNGLVALIFLFDQCPGSYFYIKNVNIWYIITYYVFVTSFMLIFLSGRGIDKQSELC